MNQSANLEARVRALEIEYARLHERLRTVGVTLGGAESLTVRTAPADERASVPQQVRQNDKRTKSTLTSASPRQAQKAGAKPPAAAEPASQKTAPPGPSSKKNARGAQAAGTHKWFDKGEARALFRRILKRPMRTRDLMERVVEAKGQAHLPEKDLERFKWAVHSALKEAISANAIVRHEKGVVAVGSGIAPVAGKAQSNAKK